MDAQCVLNIIFGILMVFVLAGGSIYLFARACDEDWEYVIGAAIGAIMTVTLYGIYVLSNLPK